MDAERRAFDLERREEIAAKQAELEASKEELARERQQAGGADAGDVKELQLQVAQQKAELEELRRKMIEPQEGTASKQPINITIVKQKEPVQGSFGRYVMDDKNIQ